MCPCRERLQDRNLLSMGSVGSTPRLGAPISLNYVAFHQFNQRLRWHAFSQHAEPQRLGPACPLVTGAARPHLHVPGGTPPSSHKTQRQKMVNRGAERRTPPLASCLDRRSTCSEQTRNILLNPTPGGLALQLNRLPQDRDAILLNARRPLAQTDLPPWAHSDDRSHPSGRGRASGPQRGPGGIEP